MQYSCQEHDGLREYVIIEGAAYTGSAVTGGSGPRTERDRESRDRRRL